MRMKFLGIFSLVVILSVAMFGSSFYLPDQGSTYYISGADTGWNYFEDGMASLEVFHKDSLFNFDDSSYVLLRWMPYLGDYKSTEESTTGKLITLYDTKREDLLGGTVEFRYKVSDSKYFGLEMYHESLSRYKYIKSDEDLNGKYEYKFYVHEPSDYRVKAFYAQDFGMLTGKFGLSFEYTEDPYKLWKAIDEDGTKTYRLDGRYSSLIPDSSATSFYKGYVTNDYSVYGSLYLSKGNIWIKDATYHTYIKNYVHFITPLATMEPVNGFVYYDMNAKDEERSYQLSGELGMDFSVGSFKISPSMYVDKFNINKISFYRMDADDKSSYNWTDSGLTIQPKLSLYIPFVETKVEVYYKNYKYEGLNFSYDSDGKLNIEASDVAYNGAEYSADIVRVSSTKKFSLLGMKNILYGYFEYSNSRMKSLDYDVDMNGIFNNEDLFSGYVYYIDENGRLLGDYPFDTMDLKLELRLTLYKDFLDNKVVFGGTIKGRYSYTSENYYYYDSEEDKVVCESSRDSYWDMSLLPAVFLSIRMTDNLYVGVYGRMSGGAFVNYPEKSRDDGTYLSDDTVEKYSNTNISMVFNIKYSF